VTLKIAKDKQRAADARMAPMPPSILSHGMAAARHGLGPPGGTVGRAPPPTPPVRMGEKFR
jgi:hypothetical protein